MFLESDRVQIRMYLGASSMYLQADFRLESAITAAQSVADGGSRPDSSTEVQIKAIVTQLQQIDAYINQLALGGPATQADEVKIDAARETARLRSVGRFYVHRMARLLDTEPYADVFSASALRPTGYPNWPIHGRDPYSF